MWCYFYNLISSGGDVIDDSNEFSVQFSVSFGDRDVSKSRGEDEYKCIMWNSCRLQDCQDMIATQCFDNLY